MRTIEECNLIIVERASKNLFVKYSIVIFILVIYFSMNKTPENQYLLKIILT